jgi:cation:H+ antiporter
VQFGLAFYFHNDESRTIVVLTYMAWLYLILATGMFIWNYRCLIECFRKGLLARGTTAPNEEALKDDE